MSTLPFIDQQRSYHLAQQLCQVFGVVPSRYHARRMAQEREVVGKPEPVWETEMLTVFDHHKRCYDTLRLQVDLRELGR